MTGPKPRKLTYRRKNVGVGLLGLGELRVDPELQQRAAIDPDTVRDYADAIKAGVQLPALVAFEDSEDPGRGCWLADGFHRQLAYREAGVLEVLVDLRRGTRRDALRHSIGANDSHGLRRTRADKRRAVTTALADAEWSQLSDRELAEMTGTSHTFVGIVRRELAEPEGGNVATPEPTAPELPLLADPPTAALLPRQCDAVWTDGSRCVWRLGHPGNHTAPDEQDQLQSWEGDAPPAEASPSQVDEPDLYPTREPPAGEWTAAPLEAALPDRIDEALRPPPAAEAQVELFARQLRSLWIPGAGPEGAPIALTRLRREAEPEGAPADLFERAVELGAGLGWWRVAGDCLLEQPAETAPACGSPHPVSGKPCTEIKGHTWSHSYIREGHRLGWPNIGPNARSLAEQHAIHPRTIDDTVKPGWADSASPIDPALCGAQHPNGSAWCGRDPGHDGPHKFQEGNRFLSWSDVVARSPAATVEPEVAGEVAALDEEQDDETVLVVAKPAAGPLPVTERAAGDAYWTPDATARACMRWLVDVVGFDPSGRVVEPSVGGGAWVRAIRSVVPESTIDRVDTDESAPGVEFDLRPDDARSYCDWLEFELFRGQPVGPDTWELCIGNPPYGGDLVRWLDASLARARVVAYLLRETVTGSVERLAWWKAHRPAWIAKVLPRPRWEGPGQRETSDYSDHVLVVWIRGVTETRWDWIDCREPS
jgi:hypothetical protein